MGLLWSEFSRFYFHFLFLATAGQAHKSHLKWNKCFPKWHQSIYISLTRLIILWCLTFTFECQTKLMQRDSFKDTPWEFVQFCVHMCKRKHADQPTSPLVPCPRASFTLRLQPIQQRTSVFFYYFIFTLWFSGVNFYMLLYRQNIHI